MLLSAAVSLVVSVAAAEVATDAAAPSPPQFDVFPAEGTTLPENGRLLVKAAERVLITHDDGRVEDLAPSVPITPMLDGTYATVSPTLTAGEVISLEAVCATCGGMEPLTWSVGPADFDVPSFGEPSQLVVSGYGATVLTPRLGFSVEFAVPLGEPAVVSLEGEGVALNQFGYDEADLGFYVGGGEERVACFTLTVTDIADNVAEPRDVCIDLVDSEAFGCAQGSASSTALFALSALLLRRRRRAVSGD